MKKWHKALALLLAAVLALGLTACGSGEEARQPEQPSYEDEEAREPKKTSREDKWDRQESQAKSLYERGIEMIDLIRQMADSEEVLALKFGFDRDMLDELNSAPEGEPIAALAHMRKSSLDCVYQIKIPLETYWEIVESYLEEQGLDMDDIAP